MDLSLALREFPQCSALRGKPLAVDLVDAQVAWLARQWDQQSASRNARTG